MYNILMNKTPYIPFYINFLSLDRHLMHRARG